MSTSIPPHSVPARWSPATYDVHARYFLDKHEHKTASAVSCARPCRLGKNLQQKFCALQQWAAIAGSDVRVLGAPDVENQARKHGIAGKGWNSGEERQMQQKQTTQYLRRLKQPNTYGDSNIRNMYPNNTWAFALPPACLLSTYPHTSALPLDSTSRVQGPRKRGVTRERDCI